MPKQPWYPQTGRQYEQVPSHQNFVNLKHFFDIESTAVKRTVLSKSDCQAWQSL